MLLPFINPDPNVLYYIVMLLPFLVLGWFQVKVARVGQSKTEILLILLDWALMIFILLAPNPFDSREWPLAMGYRFDAFKCFYVLLASVLLAYSWRTMRLIGYATALFWAFGFLVIWLISAKDHGLRSSAYDAFGIDGKMAVFLDPNNLHFDLRLHEVVVFVIVAMTLTIAVRRRERLLMEHTVLERERTSLARYFSPNMVEELSQNDEPPKQIRMQDIAVLFVDIVGFTHYAASRAPQDVIKTLRDFHQHMEIEIFRHDGTLDKYLGDGLMATFGTPTASDHDAKNAMACAKAMIRAVDRWNDERAAKSEPTIKVGFGLHYAPVVLGDFGANRLEFAVIGNTVNVASRIEALTRDLSTPLAVSDHLMARLRQENTGEQAGQTLVRHDDLAIRGIDQRMTVWTLPETA